MASRRDFGTIIQRQGSRRFYVRFTIKAFVFVVVVGLVIGLARGCKG